MIVTGCERIISTSVITFWWVSCVWEKRCRYLKWRHVCCGCWKRGETYSHVTYFPFVNPDGQIFDARWILQMDYCKQCNLSWKKNPNKPSVFIPPLQPRRLKPFFLSPAFLCKNCDPAKSSLLIPVLSCLSNSLCLPPQPTQIKALLSYTDPVRWLTLPQSLFVTESPLCPHGKWHFDPKLRLVDKMEQFLHMWTKLRFESLANLSYFNNICIYFVKLDVIFR